MIVPPPPITHDPVVAFKINVVPVLVSVPVTFTVPPLRTNVPTWAVVTVPPKFSAVFVTVNVPVLLHAPLSVTVESVAVMLPVFTRLLTVSVPPLIARIVPWFVTLCPEIVIFPALTSAVMLP